jgi:hypothetical protein
LSIDEILNLCDRRVGDYKRLNRPTVFHVRLRLMKIAAYRNDYPCPLYPYLTRAIADNPIALQCEEPNLSTPLGKLSHMHKFSAVFVHAHISLTY